MALADQHTSVMDGLGEAELVDAGLQATLQEVLNFQCQHVIELHTALIEHTDTDQTANEGIAFEETLWVLFVEGEKLPTHSISTIDSTVVIWLERVDMGSLPSSTTDLGEGELHTPHLALVAESVFADDLQLGVTVSSVRRLMYADVSGG